MSILGGVLLLILAGMAWSGKWWKWARSRWLRSTPITLVPAFGLALVFGPLIAGATTVVNSVIALLVVLAVVVSLIFIIVEPRWFGPRWYRRFKLAFAEGDFWGRQPDMASDESELNETSVTATERHLCSGRSMPPGEISLLLRAPLERFNRFEGLTGLFLYYPQAAVFSLGGDDVDVPIDEVIPTEYLSNVQRVAPGTRLDGSVDRSRWRSRLIPRLRIDTTEGSWLFETRKAKRMAREIRWRYLDDSRDMYGLPLRPGRKDKDWPARVSSNDDDDQPPRPPVDRSWTSDE